MYDKEHEVVDIHIGCNGNWLSVKRAEAAVCYILGGLEAQSGIENDPSAATGAELSG